MKTILITLMLVSAPCWAVQNFFPVGKEGAKTVYTKQAKCQEAEGQDCYDVTNKDPRYHKVESVSSDDLSKPILKTPYNKKQCGTTREECVEQMATDPANYCDAGDGKVIEENKLMPGFSYHCTSILGYEQIVANALVEDAALKATVEAADAAAKAKADAEAAVYKNMAFGKQVKAKISVINASRNLSSAQVVSFVDTFESINRLLDAGAIQTARDQINGLTPDEDLLRQQDKDEILAVIDEYLAQ